MSKVKSAIVYLDHENEPHELLASAGDPDREDMRTSLERIKQSARQSMPGTAGTIGWHFISPIPYLGEEEQKEPSAENCAAYALYFIQANSVITVSHSVWFLEGSKRAREDAWQQLACKLKGVAKTLKGFCADDETVSQFTRRFFIANYPLCPKDRHLTTTEF